MNQDQRKTIRCHLTVPFECGYLPDRKAVNLVIDPTLPLNSTLLGALLNNGFRRSGGHVYRPQCPDCQECIPIRIPVKSFRPDRSQRRNWHRNRNLRHTAIPAQFHDEHFDLYRNYLNTRHAGSDMANAIPADYIGFLTAPGINTVFHEFRRGDKLLAIAVTDHTPNGLSAVYTFFDPDEAHLGLGTFAILWQIHHARQLGLPWLYLGYWIRECRKMSYKSRFTPCEGFIDNEWQKIASSVG
jgi:arginyl-tRNA--protein-N-Asp/Glu arginylyltransferase